MDVTFIEDEATFDEYNSNGVLVNSSSMGEAGEQKIFDMGSQAGGFNPFFCNADQSVTLNGTIGAYKAFYKYGVLRSVKENSELIFNNTVGDIDAWQVVDNDKLTYITEEQPLRAELQGAFPIIDELTNGTNTNVTSDFFRYYLEDSNSIPFTGFIDVLDTVINTTTGKIARVLEVVSDTKLRIDSNIMRLGDTYIITKSSIELQTETRIISDNNNDNIFNSGTPINFDIRGYYKTSTSQMTDYSFKVKIQDINDINNRRILTENLQWVDDNAANDGATVWIEKEVTSTSTTEKKYFSRNITTEPLPFDAYITIYLMSPQNYNPESAAVGNSSILYEFFGIAPDVEAPQIKGESFTARYIDQKATTKTELKTDFFTGDSSADVYIGAIENVNGDSVTNWRRRKGGLLLSGSKKVLDWLAWERLLIQRRNQKQLTGSIRGFLPYLAAFRITEIATDIFGGVNQMFMLTKYTYNTKIEQLNVKVVRIDSVYAGTDNKVIVDFNLESEEIVEPKIIG